MLRANSRKENQCYLILILVCNSSLVAINHHRRLGLLDRVWLKKRYWIGLCCGDGV
ncbi:hypothetical protein HCH_06561 [Hahella chejuensis KCTC 2396]|uniref:Uncharacterized protein n=1 Tax=Hahella chejuensis (strain KCTC 2396) TaxID=349521 RepID=Q2S824_HAHCH|nr:hypothetical protein HCH_06561 [Hahella chejuensis KCTC 2396]